VNKLTVVILLVSYIFSYMSVLWIEEEKRAMTNLEITDGLLVSRRTGQISPENGGVSVVVEFTPSKETTVGRISGVVPGQASVEAATPFQPVETTIAEVPTRPGNIRWWDLFFIALNAYLGCLILCFVFALVAGVLYFAMGYGTNFDAFAAEASANFYFTEISAASFYLALLLAMRRVLRKRRGRGSLAGYFRPIGGRRLFYAALSGLALSWVVLLVLAVLWSAVHWQHHRTATEVAAQPHSLGQLSMLGLIGVVLAPLTEEMFFRGLLLEWLQQRLASLPSALITAAIFALWHLRFLGHPGMAGWIATAVIAAMGLLCALWAQRTHSLRAPAAAHATYNATLMLVAFLGH
jgi:membrane protease YdiL (CAAX protease family)